MNAVIENTLACFEQMLKNADTMIAKHEAGHALHHVAGEYGHAWDLGTGVEGYYFTLKELANKGLVDRKRFETLQRTFEKLVSYDMGRLEERIKAYSKRYSNKEERAQAIRECQDTKKIEVLAQYISNLSAV